MNVSLTPELEAMINGKVKSGRYNTASEVVREGLRLLAYEDEIRELRRDELRKEIARGAEQIRDGKFLDIDASEDRIRIANRIKSEARKIKGRSK
jgi:antitoxin ParD1/3/4